jgi:hypothetical protein
MLTQAVKLNRVMKMTGSIPDWNTENMYADLYLSWYSSVPQANCCDITASSTSFAYPSPRLHFTSLIYVSHAVA